MTPWNRFEQTAYDLAYYGEDPITERLIVEAISRLPERVAEFALDRCRFLSVGLVTLGMAMPGKVCSHPFERRTRNMWLILLAEGLPDEDAHSIVAHEIAHAWLGHDRLSVELPTECERDAATLTYEWGFTGKGADPGYCSAC